MPAHLKPEFLTADDVIHLHADQILEYGGSSGLRDLPALESAVAQPQATFGGEYLHNSLWLMAAAYLFHVTNNHPFVDGNKRAGLAAALTFLRINRIIIETGTDELADLTLRVARGAADKTEVAIVLENLWRAETEGEAAQEANPADEGPGGVEPQAM
jgi:death-on-curing protein